MMYKLSSCFGKIGECLEREFGIRVLHNFVASHARGIKSLYNTEPEIKRHVDNMFLSILQSGSHHGQQAQFVESAKRSNWDRVGVAFKVGLQNCKEIRNNVFLMCSTRQLIGPM